MKKEPGYFREWCIETPIEKCAQNTINTNKFLHCVVYAAWKKGAEGSELDRCEVGWVTSLTPYEDILMARFD